MFKSKRGKVQKKGGEKKVKGKEEKKLKGKENNPEGMKRRRGRPTKRQAEQKVLAAMLARAGKAHSAFVLNAVRRSVENDTGYEALGKAIYDYTIDMPNF